MRMEPIEKWIWLPGDRYPEKQKTTLTVSSNHETFAVCQLRRTYETGRAVRDIRIRFSADTAVVLYLNGKHLATGPSGVGGDFLFGDRVFPQHYATELHLSRAECTLLEAGKLEFFACVKMQPTRQFEISHGHGGFFLTAHVTFDDGTKTVLLSDESWEIRRLGAYLPGSNLHSSPKPAVYDGTVAPDEWVGAEVIPNIWHCLTSPLEPCTEAAVEPENGEITVSPGETVTRTLEFDRIYACYLTAEAKTSSPLRVTVVSSENGENGPSEEYTFVEDTSYRSFDIYSVGSLFVTVTNDGDTPASVKLGIIAVHYPVHIQAKTTTSDDGLNLVTDVCAHTLKYCRQTIHLDSPRHCEPLACTGDYYIEALMTQFTFGDQTLSQFDIRRTAQLLRYHDGRMFHTTYSLIWVQMLWDVYMLTGDRTLLSDCEDALTMLLERFASYVGENGIIENPPDYMFIDWLYPDGISLHHPPKALGQTCMNMFCCGALRTAVHIYNVLGEHAMASQTSAAADKLQSAVCDILYDSERGLFFEGLNTPTPEHLVCGPYMPPNIEKRYYRKHANILAAYFGILDRDGCRELVRKVMTDDSLGDIQPYFSHFLLDAVYRCGLREEYTLDILRRWIEPCRDCPKGLAEGFIAPEGYIFDHSHAWGGTPAYSLPLALSGLRILEPGYSKISLAPNLLGLDSAHVEIPTPHGMIVIDMKRGEDGDQINDVNIPAGIVVFDGE